MNNPFVSVTFSSELILPSYGRESFDHCIAFTGMETKTSKIILEKREKLQECTAHLSKNRHLFSKDILDAHGYINLGQTTFKHQKRSLNLCAIIVGLSIEFSHVNRNQWLTSISLFVNSNCFFNLIFILYISVDISICVYVLFLSHKYC